jgi:dihydrodipicolinate synthase/N-acetylneuraminate lyase
VKPQVNRVFVAVTTPFSDDNQIDFEYFTKHLKLLQESGVNSIFVGGTTGEFSALTFNEKIELLKCARKNFTGQVVFNVSSTALIEAIALAKVAEKEGADFITALPPFYTANAPEQGVVNFLKELKASVALPLIIYSFDRHSQNGFTPEMLSKIDYVAIKDSDKKVSLIGKSNNYLTAGDSAIESAVKSGAVGVVSVQGNYRPKEVLELFNRACKNEDVSKLQEDVARVSAVFRTENQIARIKQGVSVQINGYPTRVRLPLLGVDEDEICEINEVLK